MNMTMTNKMYLGLLILTALLAFGCAGIPNSPQKTSADIINDNKDNQDNQDNHD